MTHAGMLKKAKDQLLSAHSPEPLKTISKTSLNGKLEIIKSRPGPHPGTLSEGRFCIHTCLAATPTPIELIIIKNIEARILEVLRCGGLRAINKKNRPNAITAIL